MSESKTVQIPPVFATVQIRDMDQQLWRQVKARAAAIGVPVKEFVAAVLTEAVNEPLSAWVPDVNAPNEVRPA